MPVSRHRPRIAALGGARDVCGRGRLSLAQRPFHSLFSSAPPPFALFAASSSAQAPLAAMVGRPQVASRPSIPLLPSPPPARYASVSSPFPLPPPPFLAPQVLAEKMDSVGMDPKFLGRDVNSGFSGGEKKRNEILQMALLEPELAILDETDSGLDIDALKTVAAGINAYRSDNNAIVLITHYQRLLDYIKPDYVHIMYKGQIVRSGGPELALELERDGYAFLGNGVE